MSEGIQLIVGLGNPGAQYEQTRHNAGAWLVQRLAEQERVSCQADRKFSGRHGRVRLQGRDIKLLLPTTFMNRSGRAVSAMVAFFKIPVEEILVVHDELDIPPGTGRFKQGGGHGGHNGLRDIMAALGGNGGFHRLRIGIGHPGSSDQVIGYVLQPAPKDEHVQIDACIDAALDVLPFAVEGDWQKAMNRLHSIKPKPAAP